MNDQPPRASADDPANVPGSYTESQDASVGQETHSQHWPDGAALMSAKRPQKPELVVALVSALGTSVRSLVGDFRDALTAVGYDLDVVRVSELIHELHTEAHGPQQPTSSHARQLMDEGDALRKAVSNGGAAVALAITKIRSARKNETGDFRRERPGVATLIRSVKHEDEVRLLRTVYGPRLLVVGVSASVEQRRHAIRSRLLEEDPGKPEGWYAAEVTSLLERDQKDETNQLGQAVRKAFSLSDAFLWVRPGRSTSSDVNRLIGLWFGKPFVTPTVEEQGMYHAFAAQFRSAASGRQVGAAIVDEEGEILATGTNEVPKPGGGQYWPGDDPDHRDFLAGYDANDREKYRVVQDLLQRLSVEGWLQPPEAEGDRAAKAESLVSQALSGPLRDSRVMDLLEFGRIAHAEMAAITTAARRGTPIRDASLFTTTYPCHECARLIIAAGIRSVVYIDPYPKSQVPELYRSQVAQEGEGANEDLVLFLPFEGVAPRLFPSVFAMSSRSRDLKGEFVPWEPAPRLASQLGAIAPTVGFETAVAHELLQRLEKAGWSARLTSPTPSQDVGGD